ncbi:MAG TPA: glutamate-1-semialdehyde 2,1-aminomutase [Rubricoccaceae bacterium]|jgi:glutamate-1-semialdehyde 2,1-aminomutase
MSYSPPDPERWARSREHQAAMHRLVPGGAHTYARGDDQMPEAMPVVIARGQGCRVEDIDGNRYIEYGMGLRAVTLGHAEPRVTAAAAEWLSRGVGFSRPASIERGAAETFLELISGAERVKFCKDGSSATTAAVKLARAATGRDMVAVCIDHPFLSQDDWFIGTTGMDAGIPRAVRDLTVPFPYGDLDALTATLDAHNVACVVMEATRGADDPTAYLRAVQALCRARGVVFVLDEMITGFRWHARGAQGLYGLTPDLSTFGKALANGFSVSALAGRADLMDLGGMTTDADRVFLLSSTHGAETHALAAAVAAMTITRDEDTVGTMERAGARLRRGAEDAIAAAGVDGFVGIAGRDSNLVFTTADAHGRPSQPYRTLMLQELTRRGILGPSFVVSAAHDDDAVDETVDAFAAACRVYHTALDAGSVEPFGVGRPVQPAIRRQSGTVWTAPVSPASTRRDSPGPTFSTHTPAPSP